MVHAFLCLLWLVTIPARLNVLIYWGRATHIYVGNLAIISSDNGLSPGRRQTIIWTNTGILLMGPLGTNFSVILIEIHTFPFKKIHFETVVCEMTAILSGPQYVEDYLNAVGAVTQLPQWLPVRRYKR